MEFDKKILMRNIAFLIKKKKMKVGELEKLIGVSPGYISRISKKNNGVATGIDIIKKIADAMEVSVDVLISVDLEKTNDNDVYILNLLKNLEKKTEAREMFWKKLEPHTVQQLLSGEMNSDIPMLEIAPGQHYSDFGFDPGRTYIKNYNSYFLGPRLVQGGSGPNIPCAWYEYKLDENSTIYITYMYLQIDNNDYEDVIELYIDTAVYREEYDEDGGGGSWYDHESTPLCCSETMGEDIDRAIRSLYSTISKHQNDIRITAEVKNLLDDFIRR